MEDVEAATEKEEIAKYLSDLATEKEIQQTTEEANLAKSRISATKKQIRKEFNEM